MFTSNTNFFANLNCTSTGLGVAGWVATCGTYSGSAVTALGTWTSDSFSVLMGGAGVSNPSYSVVQVSLAVFIIGALIALAACASASESAGVSSRPQCARARCLASRAPGGS